MISVEKPGTPAEMVKHFGIKGMHWGIRKERETSDRKPAKKISERKENRAKKHDAEAKRAQAGIDAIKAKPKTKNPFSQINRNNHIKEHTKVRDRHIKAAKDIRAGHLTDHQKRVIVGASAAAVVLAAYGTYKLVDTGQAHSLLSRNTPLKKNDLLSRKMSRQKIMHEVVKPINTGFYDDEIGTKVNCRRCTFAYEMRRRGHDVKATRTIRGSGQIAPSILRATDPKSKAPTSVPGFILGRLKETDKGGPLTKLMEPGESMGTKSIGKGILKDLDPKEKSTWIFDELAKNPTGARGELGMKWYHGGAHSMAWEIIDGHPAIFDTQTGKSYARDSFAKDVAPMLSEAGQTRLDNLDLNIKFLTRWIRNVE